MKKQVLLIIIVISAAITATAQVPRFSKYQVNQTGRYAYYPADPGLAEATKSEDGSDVYTLEIQHEANFYGTIMISFADGVIGDGNGQEELETLLTSYLDFLKGQLAISGSAGYGMGHTLESNPEATGVIDYWESEDGAQWVIKGWVDKNTLAVMYIYGGELPAQPIQELFLNGFRFN